MRIPSASLSYDENYHVKLIQAELQAIAKKKFATHRHPIAEKIHRASQFFLLPLRKSAQLFARSFQSRPGANKHKHSFLRSRPLRLLLGCFSFIALTLSSVFALLTWPVHFAALLVYKSRPILSYINAASSEAMPALSQEKPLHVRTHNLGFVVESMGISGDLRPVKKRAQEVADNILEDKEHQPDIIFFQEVFHEDASRILCNKLKKQYHSIISGVLPTASGFNSGTMIASKYPILDLEFHCFQNFIGPERLSPRGIMRIKIQTQQGPVNIYSVHTQALLGKDRASSRLKQLQQIKNIMQNDFAKDKLPQMVMGDFNTSELSAWGEKNRVDRNPEVPVLEKLHQEFDDIYLRDHDQTTGLRNKEAPRFLESDNKRMALSGERSLPEPSGSWYVGPFATNNTWLASNILKHQKRDRKRYGYVAPVVVPLEKPIAWGTPEWRKKQPANTARFDYVLFPRYKDHAPLLEGRAEIRRVVVPQGTQSAPSDHLPVDGLVWKI